MSTPTRYESTGTIFEPNDTSLKQLQISAGLGDYSIANALNLYGLNHLKTHLPTALNCDGQGYVFFTRPDLRLSYDNLAQDRQFAIMLNNAPDSVWGWVRATLAPRESPKNYPSPFVDPNNPFIPILTNNIKSLSGWNEVVVDPSTTETGYFGEAHSIADGFHSDFGVRSLSATFENQIGDPLNKLFTIWTRYQMMVKQGIMDPYLEYIVLNVLDYNTRIYRIVTDSTKTYINNIAAVGAAFPLNSQLAAKFDYSNEKPLQEVSNEVSIQFQCTGMIYDDPILMREFNDLVTAFCPGIKNGSYVKLEKNERKAFNMSAIPYINLDNGKLDWYVNRNAHGALRGVTEQ